MKMITMFVLIIVMISIVSCKKGPQMDLLKNEVETEVKNVVDSLGDDIHNLVKIEEELAIDEFNNLDSELAGIENI